MVGLQTGQFPVQWVSELATPRPEGRMEERSCLQDLGVPLLDGDQVKLRVLARGRRVGVVSREYE